VKLTRLLMPESPAHPMLEARQSITLHAESIAEGKLLGILDRLIMCGVDVRDGVSEIIRTIQDAAREADGRDREDDG